MLMISAAVFTPPSDALLHAVAAGQHLAHHLVQVLQRLGWMPSSVAMRTITSLRWRSLKQLEHVGHLVELQVHQDRGDDLRVLVAQQLGHRARVHPLQALDAADTSLPCRMRSISRLALSSPSALRSTS
jgi:hypothetical protein